MMMVCPCSREHCCRYSSSATPVRESSAPVGSSAKITCGRVIRARAIATRCCWPPESWLGRWVRRSVRPRDSTTSASTARSGLRPASSSGNRMFCSAVRVGSRLKDWNTNPIWSRRILVTARSGSLERSCCPTHTDPLVARSSPAMQCIRVDLPDPDGPMMAVKDPASMVMVTSLTATTGRGPPSPNTLVRFWAPQAGAVTGGAMLTIGNLPRFDCSSSTYRPGSAGSSL